LLHFCFLLHSSVSAVPQHNMLVQAYGLVLLLILLPCVSASLVRAVGDEGRDKELFTPGVSVLQPAAGPTVTARTGPVGRTRPGPQALALGPRMMDSHPRTDTTRATATADAEQRAALKKALLLVIPSRSFGAPATNVTTDAPRISRIEELVRELEPFSPYAGKAFADNPEALSTLSGGWRLLYSDASEITRLVKLPLGFKLGAVFQAINASTGMFENQALVKHSLRLLSGHTRVIAKFWLNDDLGAINRAGVTNSAGNRVNVKFLRVIFTLRRFLILPTFGLVRKVAQPRGPAEQAGVGPSIDVTYLDDSLRISRGGDGSLFVLSRADGADGKSQPMRMLGEESAELAVTSESAYNAATDFLPGDSTKTT